MSDWKNDYSWDLQGRILGEVWSIIHVNVALGLHSTIPLQFGIPYSSSHPQNIFFLIGYSLLSPISCQSLLKHCLHVHVSYTSLVLEGPTCTCTLYIVGFLSWKMLHCITKSWALRFWKLCMLLHLLSVHVQYIYMYYVSSSSVGCPPATHPSTLHEEEEHGGGSSHGAPCPPPEEEKEEELSSPWWTARRKGTDVVEGRSEARMAPHS